MDYVSRVDFPVAVMERRKRAGKFVSLADLSFTTTGQRKEVKESRIFVYLCAFNGLSCLSDYCAAGPFGMHDVLLSLFEVVMICAVAQIFHRISKRLFKSHYCDDVSKGFKKEKEGECLHKSLNSPSLLESCNFMSSLSAFNLCHQILYRTHHLCSKWPELKEKGRGVSTTPE